MEIHTRHIGKSFGSSSTIIQLICRANGAEITTDVTNLKGYVDKNLIKIKSSLEKNLNRIDDQVTKIKLQETINLIEPVLKSSKMKDDYIITLMQYHELNKELSVL